MIQGIELASEAIRDQQFTCLKVYDCNPKGKDATPCIMLSADCPEDLADSFEREMARRSANCQYWMLLYDKGNKGSTINPFVKEGLGALAKTDNAPSAPISSPTTMSKDLITLSAENERLKIQLEHKTQELEQAQGIIVNLQEELDEYEDDEDDPFTASIMNMLSGFVGNKPGEALGGGDVMTALMKIKSVSPEAEALLIKLGKLAETNPEQLKGFITQVNSSL